MCIAKIKKICIKGVKKEIGFVSVNCILVICTHSQEVSVVHSELGAYTDDVFSKCF